MRAVGTTRLLHMSALNASAQAPSHYLRSKAAGEEAVRRSGLRGTVFRPSVIFGPRDSFVNRFATLLRLMPGIFPLACPDARLQPVCIDDVTQAFAHALTDERTVGQSYNLCGPVAYTLREIVTRIAGWTGRRVRIVGLGRALSYAQALVMEFAPGKPFSLDNFRSLQVDSVCPGPFPAVFGIVPAAFEAEVPRYLSAGRNYDRFRAGARR
jgi:NADH dehydrogenase